MPLSRKTAPLLGLALLPFVLGLAARPAQAQLYTLTILGSASSSGNAVNNMGQVAGVAAFNGVYHAFLSGASGGMLKDLGTLPGNEAFSVGIGVNNAGQVAGQSSSNTNGFISHAFLSGPNGGPLKDLGTFGGTFGTGNAVNDTGQVTGNAALAGNGTGHAFLSGPNGGSLKDLGTLPGDTGSSGAGVNAAGQVAGSSVNADGTINHAFLSAANGGTLKDLGTLRGFDNSLSNAVNSTGQVTGVAFNFADQSVARAFLSGANGGPLQDLGTIGGFVQSIGDSVNAAGQVAGYCSNADSSISSAFLFSNGVMTDLNSLIAPGSGFTLDTANGISDTGFITGVATDANGVSYAYLLTPQAPVPEASTTLSFGLLLALGMGGVVLTLRKKRILNGERRVDNHRA